MRHWLRVSIDAAGGGGEEKKEEEEEEEEKDMLRRKSNNPNLKCGERLIFEHLEQILMFSLYHFCDQQRALYSLT